MPAADFSASMFPTKLRRPRFNLTAGGTLSDATPRMTNGAAPAVQTPTARPPGLVAPGGAPINSAAPAPAGGGEINFFEGMAPGRKLAGDLINKGGAMGVFSPYFRRNALRAGALRNADAQRRRMQVFARLQGEGLDPGQERAAMMEAENNANAGVAQSLNDAELQGISSYEDYIRSLLGGERSMAEQQRMQDKQAKAAEAAGWGSMAGSLGSAFLGRPSVPKVP